MDIGYITDRGNVRKENQDRFLALCRRENGNEVVLCAVADGMGGTEKGSLASDYVTEQLHTWWQIELPCILRQKEVFADISVSLEKLLLSSNEQINMEARREKVSTGTTISLLCAYKGWMVVKHVGDSRIYMKRQGMWSQLTRDHTWDQCELEQGRDPEADQDYTRKRGKLINAMGVGTTCRIDTQMVQMMIGDRYLLCTDGIYRYVDPVYDMEGLEMHSDVSQFQLDQLAERIRRTAATDNFTAVLINVMAGSEDMGQQATISGRKGNDHTGIIGNTLLCGNSAGCYKRKDKECV